MITLTKIFLEFSLFKTSHEQEIIFCCARTFLDEKTLKRLKFLLHRNINWESLIATASSHSVICLLYWNLKNYFSELVPKTIFVQLQDIFIANAGYNIAATAELLEVLNLFENYNISAIPYKGPALAVSVYQNLLFRQFGDLDILVRQQDVLKAMELLISRGYYPEKQIINKQEHKFLKSHYHCQFSRYDPCYISLELHWQIGVKFCQWGSAMTPVNVDINFLWKQLDSVSLLNRNVPHFSPENLFLILCVHGAKDRWLVLKWVCDLAELIRSYPKIDWNLVLKQAKEQGIERQLFLGIFLAKNLLATDLPSEVWEKTQQSELVVKLLAWKIRKRFLSNANNDSGEFERFLLRFLTRNWAAIQDFFLWYTKDIRGKLQKTWNRFWFAIAPSNKDREFLSVPNSLSFIYYILRPIRLLFLSRH